jgi:hypothetical protein
MAPLPAKLREAPFLIAYGDKRPTKADATFFVSLRLCAKPFPERQRLCGDPF